MNIVFKDDSGKEYYNYNSIILSPLNVNKVKYATFLHRLKSGMTILEALNKDVIFFPNRIIIDDSNGKKYSNLSLFAKAYNKDPEIIRNRIKAGLTPYEAVTLPNLLKKKIVCFEITFNSISAFIKNFGLNRSTTRSRLRAGWSAEDTVTIPINDKKISFEGTSYKSLAALCEKFNKPYKLVHKRYNVFNWTLKDSLHKPKSLGVSIFINGKKYLSLVSAAKTTGISPGLLQYRLAAGWPPEKAIAINSKLFDKKPIKIDGYYFQTKSDAAKYYNIKPTTFIRRLKLGWNIEQAVNLLEPPINKKGPRLISREVYLKRLNEIHGDNLDFSLSKFNRAQDKVEVICKKGNKHRNFYVTPNNLLQGKGCSICKLSYGARRVARWLELYDIEYKTEWTGHGIKSDFSNNAILRIDFYLPKEKTVIEFDGAQHQSYEHFIWEKSKKNKKEAFRKLKINDKKKDTWAKKNKFKMIRIKHNQIISEVLSNNLLKK